MPEVITENLALWSSALLTRSTAGRGSNNKLEAYGIKKLRALILELAVRGKLVPQDPNDEPASVLLKRIQAEKDRLIAEGKIKKDKPLPSIADEDKPFTQPPGWVWVRLAEIGETIRGVTYGKSDASDIPQTDYVPLLRGNNINRTLNFDNPVFVPKRLLNDAQYVKAGDIVIAMSSGSADLVGKAAQATEDLEGGFGAFCGVIRPVSAEVRSFFGFFFQTPLYRNRAAGHGKGIGINNLQKTALQTLEIPLPPLAEQHRIIAKVDELMALCDQLERQQTYSIEAHQTLVATLLGTLTRVASQQEFSAAWARIASHFDALFTTEASIDQLKQTILQLAVMGKLVAQDPNDEPASKLLEHLKRKRERLLHEGKIQKAKFTQIIEDAPYDLPQSWVWTRLSFIAEVIDPNPSHRMPRYVDFGIPFISTENFAVDDKIDFSIGKCVTDETLEEQTEKFELRPGAFALSRIGTIGKTRPLPLQRSYCLSHALCVISPFDDELNSDYLRLTVTADSVLEQAHAGTKSIGVPDLGMGVIRSFLLSLPPKDEQHRIVAKVNELMALCDTLKARLADAQTIQLHLADAIVEQAVPN